MIRHRLLIAAVMLAVGLTGCDPSNWAEWGDSTRYKEDFRYDFKLSQGGRIFLESFNGSVEVLGWDKDAVEVTGTKYASREEVMKELKIETFNEPNYVRIRAIRPLSRNCNCGAKFVLRVPSKVTIERVETSNGSLRAEGLRGDARMKSSNGGVRLWDIEGNVEATTSNASIEVTKFSGAAILRTSNGRVKAEGIRGNFEATTSNASIEATVEELDEGRPLKLDSSNGSINLTLNKFKNNPIVADTSNSSINIRLPASIDASVKASTSNSSITSDFELTTRVMSKTKIDGRIGNGGPLIDLNTSNGSIRLMKR